MEEEFMMQANSIQSKRIQEILDALYLSEEELLLAEDFLAGGVGEDALGRLRFRDLSNTSIHYVDTTLRNLPVGEAERLFRVLFAVGASTCAGMFSAFGLARLKRERGVQIVAAQMAAIEAQSVGENPYGIRKNSIQWVIEAAENNADVILKALNYYKGKYTRGKLFLLALYFLLKYPDAEPESGQEVLEEDRERMKQYEEIILDSLDDLFFNKLSQDELKWIAEGIRKKELPQEVRMFGRGKDVSSSNMILLAGYSYMNCALSDCLKNVVILCREIHAKDVLKTMEELDCRRDLELRGGNFDDIFGFDTKWYIEWAAQTGYRETLKVQFLKHRELFVHYCDRASCDIAARMLDVMKEMDFEFYQEKKENERVTQKEIIINEIIKNLQGQMSDLIKRYLWEEIGIEQMIICEDQIKSGHYHAYHVQDRVNEYQKLYEDSSFFNRIQVYMLLIEYDYFFRIKFKTNLADGEILNEKEIENTFAAFDSEGLDLAHQLEAAVLIIDGFYSETRKAFFITAKKVFSRYLSERRDEMLTAFSGAKADGRYFALLVLADHAEENKKEILKFAQDSAKIVREQLLKILLQKKSWEKEMKQLLASKKAAERELAVQVLVSWDENQYAQLLEEALEKEKNGKVRALLQSVLHVEEREELTQEDIVKNIHKGGKKRSLAWAYETPFPAVHKKNGEEASEEYLQAILLCYSSMGTCGVNQEAALLAEELAEAELASYVNELFDKWMEAGAEAKKRYVLYAAAIHGGAEIVAKLQHQIQEWPQHARGAIASEAVRALTLNPLPQALLIVDGIARKFKYRQVKAAAAEALEFAAMQLGLTREELADKIVPDLGFNERMERVFDYGERKFTVMITPALDIQVFDESGKKLKNLPAPGKKDEEEKAAAAYKSFKQMKKQMKTIISSQKARLEQAFSIAREWSVKAWKELFVKNPLMHPFAIGLIWGIYEEGRLLQSFRYMEDGSFNTQEEEEFILPEKGQIGLVHPIELSEESKEAWKEQLEDYEITQPIEQLSRPVFCRTEEEMEQKSLERFGGCILNDMSLKGKLIEFGWYWGAVVIDGGGFLSYYREDAELGVGVELGFSGGYAAGEIGAVTVYNAVFYPVGAGLKGRGVNGTSQEETSFVRMDAKGNKLCSPGQSRSMEGSVRSFISERADIERAYALKEIPERYFSEIVLQLSQATASSKERDENWAENLRKKHW